MPNTENKSLRYANKIVMNNIHEIQEHSKLASTY
jgi:hypothetical protein